MGFDLAASVAVGLLLGWWIDQRWEVSPWGVIICSSIGIIGGLLNFVRAAQRASRAAARRAEEGQERAAEIGEPE